LQHTRIERGRCRVVEIYSFVAQLDLFYLSNLDYSTSARSNFIL
jgi:hypothetical protein